MPVSRTPAVGEIWEAYHSENSLVPLGHQVLITKVDSNGFESVDIVEPTKTRMWSHRSVTFWDLWRIRPVPTRLPTLSELWDPFT